MLTVKQARRLGHERAHRQDGAGSRAASPVVGAGNPKRQTDGAPLTGDGPRPTT